MRSQITQPLPQSKGLSYPSKKLPIRHRRPFKIPIHLEYSPVIRLFPEMKRLLRFQQANLFMPYLASGLKNTCRSWC